MKTANTRRVETLDAIKKALPGTLSSICERSGFHRTTVGPALKELRAKSLVRVCKWLPHPVHGPSISVFGLGKDPDVIDNLPRLTKQQRSERYTAKLRGTEKHDQRKAKWRARHWLKKAAKAPQSWLSALGV